MKIIQAGIASLLVVAFAAALPGLYYQTESGSPSDASNPASGSVQELDLTTVQDLSKPDPDSDQLPETTISIEKLQGETKKRARRRLMVDINAAGGSRLQTITGIGEKTAETIVEYRKQNGPFESVSELENIAGIGPATSKKIGRQILIDGQMPDVASAPPETGGEPGPSLSININTAGESELTRLDGIGTVTAQKIIEYRNTNGPIQDLEELTNVDGIGSATVEKLRKNTTL